MVADSKRMPRPASPNRNHSTVRKVMPAPAPVPAPVPASVQGTTLGQTIKDGIGFGIGSAIANRLVSNIFGPPQITIAGPKSEKSQLTEYEQCIIENREDYAVCGHLLRNK